MKKYFLFILAFNLCYCQKNMEKETGLQLLDSEVFEIVQNWSQAPDGYARSVFTKIPTSGLDKYPVAILLHGGGGRADSFINQFDYLDNHILVAPQGYMRSWNISKERSKAPDVEFIAEVISYLKKFNNVDTTNISIIGSSNGSALVNQLLIELDKDIFKKAVCRVSQLNTFQYRENIFWAQSDKNQFNVPSVPQQGRKILCLAGSNDKVAPYYGGQGVLEYVFLDAEYSAFIFAKAMGYTGEEIADNMAVEDPQNFFKYSYLDGQIIHYRLQGAGHGFGSMSTEANRIIKNFIENN